MTAVLYSMFLFGLVLAFVPDGAELRPGGESRVGTWRRRGTWEKVASRQHSKNVREVS